jgi:hypothetical protein
VARSTASRSNRLALGAAIFAAGVALLVARPGVALAHHVTVTERADCAGWETKAEYFGGDGDRKVVIDVMVNAEHLAQTLYFDNAPGHLGHMNYYLLYDRTGTGSLHTSGTITMYELLGGSYTHVVDSDTPVTDLVCATATNTATSTATPTATATATPVTPTDTPTETPVTPTDPPTSTATVLEQGTSTPIPTLTPTQTPTSTDIASDGTITPPATDTAVATSTPVDSRTDTPVPAHTSVTPDTPAPQSTPTLVNVVHSSSRSGGSTENQSPVLPSKRALPSTGQGARTSRAIFAGLLGTLLAAIGLGVCATGLRARGTE